MADIFIIAEIGVNHNGQVEIAKEMITAAKKHGASAVKFQTFKAAKTIVKGTKTVAYQKRQANVDDQHDLLSALELTFDQHRELVAECNAQGIEFMSTAFDADSLDELVELGIKRIKIPSGEVTNLPFVRHCASKGLPVILSTGMATMEEVTTAVQTIRETLPEELAGSSPSLTVLHCTSSYPAPDEMLNLNAIKTMAAAYDVAIGYSDHSPDILIAPVAVALGATMIEKHITLDRTMQGPDHAASIEADDFGQLVDNVKRISIALGDGIKRPIGSEKETAALVRRGLKASRDLPIGHQLTEEDIAILRPETGLAPAQLEETIGQILQTPLLQGNPIEKNSLKNN